MSHDVVIWNCSSHAQHTHQDRKEAIALLDTLEAKFMLPNDWRMLFESVPAVTCQGQMNKLTILSLEDLQKEMDELITNSSCDKVTNYFVDIAFAYMGMGHGVTLAYWKQEYFWRHDGGSNSYERVDRFRYYRCCSSFYPNKVYSTLSTALADMDRMSKQDDVEKMCSCCCQDAYDS